MLQSVVADDLCSPPQLYLSTRRGAWILNRVGDNGIPLDMVYNRLVYLLQFILPTSVYNGLGEKQLNQRFNHALYNLKPKHRYAVLFFSPLTLP